MSSRNPLTGAAVGLGRRGPKGDSAFLSALKEGFQGTESEWLASLKGDKGDTGDTGAQGPQGIQGIQGPLGSPMSVWTGTQAAYEALGTWDNGTLYFII